MGNLCQSGTNLFLGCEYGYLSVSNLRKIIKQNMEQLKLSIEKDKKIDYLDDAMRMKQKFVNVNMVIEKYKKKYKYISL